MERLVLPSRQIHPNIQAKIAQNHRDIVEEAMAAIEANDVVIVGMGINPHPKRACKLLERQGIAFKYLQYGDYRSQWRRRNALKMWTGWPTFPMIFVKKILIGGAADLVRLHDSGELKTMLQAGG